jgi:hypothetical protein
MWLEQGLRAHYWRRVAAHDSSILPNTLWAVRSQLVQGIKERTGFYGVGAFPQTSGRCGAATPLDTGTNESNDKATVLLLPPAPPWWVAQVESVWLCTCQWLWWPGPLAELPTGQWIGKLWRWPSIWSLKNGEKKITFANSVLSYEACFDLYPFVNLKRESKL